MLQYWLGRTIKCIYALCRQWWMLVWCLSRRFWAFQKRGLAFGCARPCVKTLEAQTSPPSSCDIVVLLPKPRKLPEMPLAFRLSNDVLHIEFATQHLVSCEEPSSSCSNLDHRRTNWNSFYVRRSPASPPRVLHYTCIRAALQEPITLRQAGHPSFEWWLLRSYYHVSRIVRTAAEWRFKLAYVGFWLGLNVWLVC